MRAVKVSETKTVRLDDECGFCGGTDLYVASGHASCTVRCNKCNARTPDCASMEDAITVWNWRFAREGGLPTVMERVATWKEDQKAFERRAAEVGLIMKATGGAA